MALVIGLLVIGFACGIAAWFVIREAGRLAAEPPPPVFDMDEAFEWVVEHLPDLVAATLTPGDVRRVERILNNRPRKCLDFKTPNQVFRAAS